MNIVLQGISGQALRDKNELATVREANSVELDWSPLFFIQLDNELQRLNKVYAIDAQSDTQDIVIFAEADSIFSADSTENVTIGETTYTFNLINIEV